MSDRGRSVDAALRWRVYAASPRVLALLFAMGCATDTSPGADGGRHEGSLSDATAVPAPAGAGSEVAPQSAGTSAVRTGPSTDAGAPAGPRTAGASGVAGVAGSAAEMMAGQGGGAGQSAPAGGTAGQPAGPNGGMGAVVAGSSGSNAADGGPEDDEPFTLTALDVEMYSATEVQFPDSSLPPTNESPGFRWSGVPAGTKSLVLAFTDVSGPAYKWILWDIPPTTMGIAAAMSDAAMPSEVPGASQLGSLGNQGYAGPCCATNEYEFVLWAIDVEKLPDVASMSTAQIHNRVLPMYELAKTPPVKMRRR